MGLLDALKVFASSVDTEYDRRIRAASNVKDYVAGGHGAPAEGHPHIHLSEVERLQGEGGALGGLQAHAGPQLYREQGTGNREQEIETRH